MTRITTSYNNKQFRGKYIETRNKSRQSDRRHLICPFIDELDRILHNYNMTVTGTVESKSKTAKTNLECNSHHLILSNMKADAGD